MLPQRKDHLCFLLLVIGFIKIVTGGDPGVITDLRVITTIERRYAQTTVISTMKNPDPESSELKFKMTLPKTAFISSFIMEIEGKNYTSNVDEKEAAKKTYENAKKRGKSGGLVEQRDSTQQKFEVSTNVAAEGKVTFYLRYEELLRRFKGKYKYFVDIGPGHVVPMVSIDVSIIENEAIRDLNVIELPTTHANEVSRHQPSPNKIHVSYSHRDTRETSGLDEGLNGKFALTYDVDMHPDGGEVQVIGNYFVHHFSPEGLPKMPVHSIFVLDVSGSMGDGKLHQAKQAMKAILQDIKLEDSFELIQFSSDVQHLGAFTGKKHSLEKALRVVDGLKTIGSTNINDAYFEAIKRINRLTRRRVTKQIVFLTDGVATAGVTYSKVIRDNIRRQNENKYPIFGLAFGRDADFKLLKEISADNRAFARKITFDVNAKSQLKGFYEEISVPLMTEVDIKYDQYEVDQNSIVKQGTSNFYSGSEVVLAGQLMEGFTGFVPIVIGLGKNGPLEFSVQRVDIQPSDPSMERENFVARLWAYLTVQDLLDRASVSEDPEQVKILKSKALETALKFNFVTKLTSLVVVQPEDESVLEEEEEYMAHLPPAHLPPAHLPPAHLPPAHLPPAHLPPAHLPPAHLPPAHLPPAHLPPAHLPPAHLPPTYLPPSWKNFDYGMSSVASLHLPFCFYHHGFFLNLIKDLVIIMAVVKMA